MKPEDFAALNEGDKVASKLTEEVYMVTGNYGDRVTAVKTVDLTNPGEWELRAKAKYNVRKKKS